jgi:catechol 2,3-dioxygenase-like lactoylglutathione lyase family enzyme
MINSGTLDDGFHEAVGVVLDVDATVARMGDAFGYRTLWRGEASQGALRLLGIAPGVAGEEALIGDPEQGRGFIRLFGFPGLPSGVMRDGAQLWDFGGIFDIDVYALKPIEAVHGDMTRAGFSAFAPVTAYDFAGMAVSEVISRDADGLAAALIARSHPPLEGFEAVPGPVSHVFNSTQIVPSFDAARAFYVEALGWKPVHETAWRHPGGSNCIGLPLDVARERMVRVGIYQARGLNQGSVEVLKIDVEGRDFSHAAPPDRGWAALRFPMADVAAFIARAAAGGCRVLAPRPVTMAPYGEVEAAAAITPWGARLEAYRPS